MRKLLYILILLLSFTFQSDDPPGWYELTLPVNKNINDIYFIDTSTGWAVTTWAPQYDTGYILHTTNGGDNWNVQYQAHVSFLVLQFTDDNTGYAGGGDGFPKLYKTTNKGEIWFIHNPIPAHSVEDLFFLNNDTGWACDSDPIFGGLFKTTNGGNTWQLQLGESYLPEKVFFINADTGWVLGSGNNLYRSTNSGINWSVQYHFDKGIHDIEMVTKDTGWILGTADFGNLNGIYKTINGGFNWNRQADPNPFYSACLKLFFLDNKRGWIACGFNKILKTVDGENWGIQQAPTGNYYSILFFDTLIGYSGGTKMLKTTDGGGPIVSLKQINNTIPKDFILYQNYPNPFNPYTTTMFKVKRLADVSLKVYDISGKLIDEVFYTNVHPGEYQYEFDGTGLTSGVYLYSLSADGKAINTRKMLLIK